MQVPTIEQAYKYIDKAKQSMLAAGIAPVYIDAFESHSIYVAKAAKLIGGHYNDLSTELLEIFGLLHDIGRYIPEKENKVHHSISGYKLMKKEGFDTISRICITHSFPMKDFNKTSEELFFNNQDDILFVKNYLLGIKYDHYDEIIQLADNISLHTGFLTIEDRFEELQKRYGTSPDTEKRKQIVLNLKDKIEGEIAKSIYEVAGISEGQ